MLNILTNDVNELSQSKKRKSNIFEKLSGFSWNKLQNLSDALRIYVILLFRFCLAAQTRFPLIGIALIYLPSNFVAGGFLVAQFVRIEREPNHWPFIAVMAFSASCNDTKHKSS